MDAAGNAYVTGVTESNEPTFPVSGRPRPDLQLRPRDAFVAKVNAAGTALVYCGYIGGDDDDCGEGIAVDAPANAYVTGSTRLRRDDLPGEGRTGPDAQRRQHATPSWPR